MVILSNLSFYSGKLLKISAVFMLLNKYYVAYFLTKELFGYIT